MGKPKTLTHTERAVIDGLKAVIQARLPPSRHDFVNEWNQREIHGARALATFLLANKRRTYDEARAVVDRECPNPYPEVTQSPAAYRRAPALMES